MLDRKEHELLQAIIEFTEEKGGMGLIRPIDLLQRVSYTIEFLIDDLEPTLEVLEMDNYIEVVSTDKRGEAYLVLTLKRKGKAYRRTIHVDRREKRNKVLFKVSLIVFGALIGQIVKRWLVPVLFG